MWFFRDIVFPIVIALLVFTLILFILNLVLRFLHVDFPIIKLIGFFGIWYYVGPIIYNWLITKIIVVERQGIEILYTPIQSILEALEKLV